ncbi:cyclophane-forming radical SAM/SPASM peptide maturase GrrM/OscB [Reyranella sp.]|uniref:cyclophane-forming radical SAM/SPASM peptide maturase GrrM/OscB n=1 Tax=Reyranella sp. TaxID=1929291 RepID=UPI003BAD2380
MTAAPTSGAPGRPEIGMVVVQPTAFCNIDCTYCYLPDRNDKHVMAQATVRRLFGEVFASGWASPDLIVLWHAGEPLAASRDFYSEAFAAIEAVRPAGVNVKHSFQTNGTLVTAEWCRLFLEWNVGIGVSVDGPQALHDRNRLTRSGRGTFDKTMAGIRCLQDNGVPFHALSVLSSESFDRPDEMLAFYEEAGIDKVCFNVEESEGTHVSPLLGEEREVLRRRFASFLRRFWHRARANGKVTFVREIDQTVPRMFRPDGVPTRNIQCEPLAMLNVDSRGNVSSFSPELLGMKNAAYGDFLLGNITINSLAEIHSACLRSALHRDIRAGTQACEAACEYYSVCGGGSPVNKLFENGSFTGTTTSFCTLTQMVPTDLILEAYDRLEQSWTGDAPAPVARSQAPTPAEAALSPRMP